MFTCDSIIRFFIKHLPIGTNMKVNNQPFADRLSVEQIEEGIELAPKFDINGLIPVITSDYKSGELLMHGYMNSDALRQSIETGEAYYWSRSRRLIWHKGATSGLTQEIIEMRIDDDQDALWLRVKVGGSGASCHVGYRSCFYRVIPTQIPVEDAVKLLAFTEDEKVFNPKEVYGDVPNPTKI